MTSCAQEPSAIDMMNRRETSSAFTVHICNVICSLHCSGRACAFTGEADIQTQRDSESQPQDHSTSDEIVEVVTGHHNTLESDVVRSSAISNGCRASPKNPVGFSSRETFRAWANRAGSINGQLCFQRKCIMTTGAALYAELPSQIREDGLRG